MNKLLKAGETEWYLPIHAYIVVYETESGEELLTIYENGSVQKPPKAQVTGNLVRIKPENEVERTQTGYIVRMRERSVLRKQDDDHWIILPYDPS
ncbi:hypothetical protein ACEU6E_05245 [Halorutilales archaeon Cl-col2-1]